MRKIASSAAHATSRETPAAAQVAVPRLVQSAGASETSAATSLTAAFRAMTKASIARMNASGARWQLITTYNEWGEGTAVESATSCRRAAPTGTLCDWQGADGVSEYIASLHNAPPPG
jgi:hypothetical protein